MENLFTKFSDKKEGLEGFKYLNKYHISNLIFDIFIKIFEETFLQSNV